MVYNKSTNKTKEFKMRNIKSFKKDKNYYILTEDGTGTKYRFNYLTGEILNLRTKRIITDWKSFYIMSYTQESDIVKYLLRIPLKLFCRLFYTENAEKIEQIIETCLSLGAVGVVFDIFNSTDLSYNASFNLAKINKRLFLKVVSSWVNAQENRRSGLVLNGLTHIMTMYFSELLKVSKEEIQDYWKQSEGNCYIFNKILENEDQANKIYNTFTKVISKIKTTCDIVPSLKYGEIISNKEIFDIIIDNYNPSRDMLLQIRDAYLVYDSEPLPEDFWNMPEYESDKFKIIYPKAVSDFVRESSNQHNCLSWYWKGVNPKFTKIGFLRKKEDLSKSFVTFELVQDFFYVKVNDGLYEKRVKWKFDQCFAKNNKPVNKQSKDFLDEYLDYINNME